MPRTRNGAVDLEFESLGDDGAEVILLVNGLGAQMTRWPGLSEALVESGYRVVRFDNRDVGLSTWPEAPYTLRDMAADAIAVLDAVNVARAHVAGVSLGGMIAQRLAIDFPDRVLSLTSIMSATGADLGPLSTPEVNAALAQPLPDPRADLEGYLAQSVERARTSGSRLTAFTDAEIRDRDRLAFQRGYNPAGLARQRQAIVADGDRTEALARLKIPVVVLHGADDPLVSVRAGRATAEAIPGAELRIVPGMGHDVTPGFYREFVDAILAAASQVKS
jgi:pimeloyl-ACP methyl ester carboxylesterase